MDINRVIKATQRTSHLSDKQMWNDYSELYELAFEHRLFLIAFNSRLYAQSKIAIIRKIACELPTPINLRGLK